MIEEMMVWHNPFPPKVGDILNGIPHHPDLHDVKIKITKVLWCEIAAERTGINGCAYDVFFERMNSN